MARSKKAEGVYSTSDYRLLILIQFAIKWCKKLKIEGGTKGQLVANRFAITKNPSFWTLLEVKTLPDHIHPSAG